MNTPTIIDEKDLDKDLKELLDKRVAHHEQNKHKAKDTFNLLNDIAQKFGYEL